MSEIQVSVDSGDSFQKMLASSKKASPHQELKKEKEIHSQGALVIQVSVKQLTVETYQECTNRILPCGRNHCKSCYRKLINT